VSRSVVRREAIVDSDRSSGLGWPERSLEEGGAGSMEVYVLCAWCESLVQ
jgi:hypothetical protein